MSSSPDPSRAAFTIPELVDRLNDPLISPTFLFTCVESFNKALMDNDELRLSGSVAAMLLPALSAALTRNLGAVESMQLALRVSLANAVIQLFQSKAACSLPSTSTVFTALLAQITDPALRIQGEGSAGSSSLMLQKRVRGTAFQALGTACTTSPANAPLLASQGVLELALDAMLDPLHGDVFSAKACFAFSIVVDCVLAHAAADQLRLDQLRSGAQLIGGYQSVAGRYFTRDKLAAAIPALAAVLRSHSDSKEVNCNVLSTLPPIMMLISSLDVGKVVTSPSAWRLGVQHGLGALSSAALQRWPDHVLLASSGARVMFQTSQDAAGGEMERKMLVQSGAVEGLVKALQFQATSPSVGNASYLRMPGQTRDDQCLVLASCSAMLAALLEDDQDATTLALALRAGLESVITSAKETLSEAICGNAAVLAIQEKVRQFRRICRGCGKEKAKGAVGPGLQACPCRTAWYCDAKCQASDWKEHKQVCPRRNKSSAASS